jgi:predicted KAP-like P-loop ATPase
MMPTSNIGREEPYISDSPETEPDKDEFKRYPFAQKIAQTIASRQDPVSLVIGIYGEWGEGKSTVLNFIERELNSKYNHNTFCFRFNPWYFRDEESLLKNFFEILADKLNNSLILNRERVGRYLQDYITPIVSTITFTPKLLKIDFGKMFDGFGETLANVSLDERKNRFEQTLNGEGKRVVILIDDIDRLDKDEIQTVFKLVKLLANFKHTTYVLAFDEEMVAAAICDKYGNKERNSGQNFIEKIVQVPLKLPKINNDILCELCFEKIKQALELFEITLKEYERKRFTDNFKSSLSIHFQNPRVVKRYVNAILFALTLIDCEVNIVDLLLIEGMRIVYPKLYSFIRSNPEEFVGLDDRRGELDPSKNQENVEKLNKILAELVDDKYVGDARNLLVCLFPVVLNILFSIDTDRIIARELSRQGESAPKRRIADQEYFNRFFEYTLPNGDILDSEIEEFLKQVEGLSDIIQISDRLKEFIGETKGDTFLLKLESRLENLSPEATRKLALSLSEVSDDFTIDKNRSIRVYYSPLTLFGKYLHLMRDLVKNLVTDVERCDLVKEIFHKGSINPFLYQLLTIIFAPEEKQEYDGIISLESQKEVDKILAKRIEDFAKDASIFELESEYIYFYFYSWSKGDSQKERIDEYITNALEKDPCNAIKLLNCCISQRGQFDNVSRFVDPKKIRTILCKPHNNFDPTNSEQYGDHSEDEKITNSFLDWYNRTKSKEP